MHIANCSIIHIYRERESTQIVSSISMLEQIFTRQHAAGFADAAQRK